MYREELHSNHLCFTQNITSHTTSLQTWPLGVPGTGSELGGSKDLWETQPVQWLCTQAIGSSHEHGSRVGEVYPKTVLLTTLSPLAHTAPFTPQARKEKGFTVSTSGLSL